MQLEEKPLVWESWSGLLMNNEKTDWLELGFCGDFGGLPHAQEICISLDINGFYSVPGEVAPTLKCVCVCVRKTEKNGAGPPYVKSRHHHTGFLLLLVF